MSLFAVLLFYTQSPVFANFNQAQTPVFRLETNPQLESFSQENELSLIGFQMKEDVLGQSLSTGKSATQAAFLSIFPGGGQFYNGDILWGIVFLVSSIGLIIIDNFVPYVGLAGFPGMAIVSAIHAGLTTQEQIIIQ
ncbi:MAG: hypothetical protein IV090_06620 [Candidatus Sericytochromatia bacterium]|nr:hypothetical protein [Candidatus Sericytochromatia bacterium]